MRQLSKSIRSELLDSNVSENIGFVYTWTFEPCLIHKCLTDLIIIF